MEIQHPPTGTGTNDHSIMERYARQTRNAAVFIAWIAGILAALALIGVVITGVELSKVSNELNSGAPATSNCLSQGGTDPSC